MQISKISYAYKNQYQNKNKIKDNRVNFEGFRFKKNNVISNAVIQNAKEEVINFINYYFSSEALSRVTVTNDVARNNMLLAFAKKMKHDEATTKTITQEAPEIFGRVSKLINPNSKVQRLILHDNRFSVAEFEELIPLIDKKENAELTENLLQIKNEFNAKLDFSKRLKGILELNSAETLNKNIDKFKSYIVLHLNEPDFVEQLGKELKSEKLSFDYKTLDKLIDIKKKQNISPFLMNLSDDSLIKGNQKAIDLLSDGYVSQVINQMSDLTPEDYKFFEYFVETSNGKNVGTRIKYLKRNIHHLNEHQPFGDMKALFERMDSDDKLQKIMDTYLDANEVTMVLPAKELMFYIDKFGTDAILKNIDSFINVTRLNKTKMPDEMVKVLESHLKNKYYMTNAEIKRVEENEKYRGKQVHFFGKIKRAIKSFFERFSAPAESVKPLNDINFANYEIIPSKQRKPLLEVVENAVQPAVKKEEDLISEAIIPELSEVERADEETVKTVMKEMESVVGDGKFVSTVEETLPAESGKFVEIVEEVPEAAEVIEQPQVKKTIVREYKSDNPKISARKLKIFNDAQEIIKSRMKSAKQIEEQAHDYSLTATKMRNKYLNELFDYVADIRKSEIKNGKKHHSVSNYDVLELYQKIKGYNEKEFRRMLRARTPEGERMYSFKEINKMLDDSMIEHYRIQQEQQIAIKEAKKPKPTPAGIVNSGLTTQQWQKELEDVFGKGKVKMQIPINL